MTAGASAGTQTVVVHVAIPRKPLPDTSIQGASVSHHRIAVVAGRRLGNAVQRNRAKRRLRAIAHQFLDPGHADRSLDIVVVAKPGIDQVAFPQLCRDVQSAYGRACQRLVPQTDG